MTRSTTTSDLSLAAAEALCDSCGEPVFTLGGHVCGAPVSPEFAEAVQFIAAERRCARRDLIAERAQALRANPKRR